jgi:RNase P protein component
VVIGKPAKNEDPSYFVADDFKDEDIQAVADQLAPVCDEFRRRRFQWYSLLPNTAAMEKLLQRFDEAGMNDVQAGRQSVETFRIGIQILRKAKIPAALRNDIRRVRELRTQAAA